MPKVSVITPAYNAEAFIGESIQSILERELPDLELLVLIDASKDGTADVIRTFGDPRLRLVHNERSLGIAGARNSAYNLAQAASPTPDSMGEGRS
jgi:glycosyltransferase involved in cell wall biosynthesis